jgi:sec-independent protein translocase protein TatA
MDLFAPWHLLLILLIVLVIFGPRKLGDVGAAIGKAVRDFKRVVGDEDDVSKPAATKPAEISPASSKESDPPQAS